LIAHLRELEAVMGEADPPQIMGYLHWTLVDNWEWHEGYRPAAQFGLYTTSGRDQAPTNRIAHGPDTTFRRQIGEGALAIRNIILNGVTAVARKSLGAISPGGERTDPG